MTFEEAIKAMQSGQKLKHRYYTHEEWTTMEDEFVVDEKGHKIHLHIFTADRTQPAWQSDWELWTGEVYEDPRDNPLTDDDSWIHDIEMGAR